MNVIPHFNISMYDISFLLSKLLSIIFVYIGLDKRTRDIAIHS